LFKNQKKCKLFPSFEWEKMEIVLNAQLLSVLGALPGELLSLGLMHMTGISTFQNHSRLSTLL
jgi:hypothetical protein